MATSNLTVENWFQTTLSSGITSSDTTIPLNNLPAGQEGYLVIEPDSTSNREIIYFTSKTGSAVVCTSAAVGRGVDGTTAVSHASGSTVKMNIVGAYWKQLQNGTAIPDDTFNLGQVNGSETFVYDFVASGGVWSGDSYGSSLNASMTAVTCFINGQRGTVSAVTARAFTASKDTYIDVLNSSGTFSLVYTEVANNAASPALAANSIRLGIIVTGANIANVGAINQGQETKLLPIASSTPYAVTDSLGNLICPRDPQRKILGLRQITSNFGTTGSITGLSVPVNIPTGRKVKVTAYAQEITNSVASNSITLQVSDSTAGSVIQSQTGNNPVATGGLPFNVTTPYTPPASGTRTFTAATAGTGTITVIATSTAPAYVLVELA